MSTQQLERDTINRPVVNPWAYKPTAAQTRYATDLCRSELAYAERVATIESFAGMDADEMSALIDRLVDVREARMKRLRRTVHGRRR